METGVARKPIVDLDRLRAASCRPAATRSPRTLQRIYDRVRRQPKRIVFAEGEEEQVMRAAVSYVNQRLGTAILVGRDDVIKENAAHAGIDLNKPGIEIINARLSRRNAAYADYLYERLQRKGYPVPRLPAPDQQRPQPFRRLHGGAGRCRRHGHRRDPQLFDRARRRAPRHRRQARPPRHRRVDRAGARPHRARRRHRRARHARRRADSPTSPRRPPASRAAWATSRASPCSPIRPSAIPQGERSERVQEAVQHPRQAPRRFRI